MCAGNINHAESNTLITYLFVVDILFDINCYLSVCFSKRIHLRSYICFISIEMHTVSPTFAQIILCIPFCVWTTSIRISLNFDKHNLLTF